ncbi:hypothetical protein, partial [Nocardiopsis sp. SBT366]|uniref:hypothetical protein n=1 Tax=Nocardiopsis sp. SBT366 TaxID=1580529 RepID=UPI001F46466B
FGVSEEGGVDDGVEVGVRNEPAGVGRGGFGDGDAVALVLEGPRARARVGAKWGPGVSDVDGRPRVGRDAPMV